MQEENVHSTLFRILKNETTPIKKEQLNILQNSQTMRCLFFGTHSGHSQNMVPEMCQRCEFLVPNPNTTAETLETKGQLTRGLKGDMYIMMTFISV